MKEKIVFAKWLAVDLMKQGFKVIRVEPRKNKPGFYCWIFEETPEFLVAFGNSANKPR